MLAIIVAALVDDGAIVPDAQINNSDLNLLLLLSHIVNIKGH